MGLVSSNSLNDNNGPSLVQIGALRNTSWFLVSLEVQISQIFVLTSGCRVFSMHRFGCATRLGALCLSVYLSNVSIIAVMPSCVGIYQSFL